MMWRRNGIVLAASLLLSSPALAGLFEDIYRGLGVFTTPVEAVGGNRFGRLAIVPNRLGRGYRVEVDRSFGADSRGRPEVYDLGNYELQLSGDVQATFGFTRRGLMAGNADIFANNLNYALRAKSGAQDAALTGTLNVGGQMEVNQLGFYTLNLEIDNTNASLGADGVLAEGQLDTDFNIGPIAVRGNVYYDGFLTALTAVGVDTSALEGLFPMSPIDQIDNALAAAFEQPAQVLGELVTADDGDILSGLELSGPYDLSSAGDASLPADGATGPLPVPEPATLALAGLLLLPCLRRRS